MADNPFGRDPTRRRSFHPAYNNNFPQPSTRNKDLDRHVDEKADHESLTNHIPNPQSVNNHNHPSNWASSQHQQRRNNTHNNTNINNNNNKNNPNNINNRNIPINDLDRYNPRSDLYDQNQQQLPRRYIPKTLDPSRRLSTHNPIQHSNNKPGDAKGTLSALAQQQKQQFRINNQRKFLQSTKIAHKLKQSEAETEKYKKGLKNLSIHSWFQIENAQQRQVLFCKTKIAFPEFPVYKSSGGGSIIPQRGNSSIDSTLNRGGSNISITTNAADCDTITTQHENKKPSSTVCPLLFDSTPRIIGDDMDTSIWSKSITCLLNQSCDAVYTFICTLCYYFKILRIIASNYNRIIQLHVPVPLTGNEPKNQEGDFIRQRQTYSITLGSRESKNLFFIACNILSMKFHDDYYHTNKIFSKIYKLPIQFLNELEMKTYSLLGWNLYLSDVVIAQVMRALIDCIDPNYKK